MAQIGTFTRDENGTYAGTIKTLTLNVKATIKPCDRDNDRAPDFRVTAGGVEFGAGWTRTARETGAEYLRSSSTIRPSRRRSTPPWSRATRASTSSSGRADQPIGAPLHGGAPLHTSGIMRRRNRRNRRQIQPSATGTPHNHTLSIINASGIDAELRALVGGIFHPGNAGFDVQCERANGAGEAVLFGSEGADGSHCRIPFSRVRAAPIAASMAVDKTGDDRTAPDKAAMQWRAASRRFVSGRGGDRRSPG